MPKFILKNSKDKEQSLSKHLQLNTTFTEEYLKNSKVSFKIRPVLL